MRKSGWVPAVGAGSLALLLAACGGPSGSNSAAGSGTGSASSQATASPGSSGQAGTSAPASSSSSSHKGGTTPGSAPSPHHTAGPQPSSSAMSIPPQGTTVMIVEHTALGFVLGEADGQVVYTYGRDTRGGSPKCTGSCASLWPPATGTPQAGPADHFPGTFGVVRGAGGVEQITYDGLPLYLYKGAKPYNAAGNGADGLWHVVPLSASDVA